MSNDSRQGERMRALSDEREFLARSLVDLERERAAGDVEDRDYEALKSQYTAKMASALRALAEIEPFEAAASTAPLRRLRRYLGRRRVRRVLTIVAVICLVCGVGLLALELSGVRLPGEQLSGSVSVPTSSEVEEELARAAVLGNAGDLTSALALYDAVLQAVPKQPVALCYRGWLERLSGLAAHDNKVIRAGDTSLDRAVEVAPQYPDARALYGVALFEDEHNAAAAVNEFAALTNDHPRAALVQGVKQKAIAAYHAVHRPVPKLFSS